MLGACAEERLVAVVAPVDRVWRCGSGCGVVRNSVSTVNQKSRVGVSHTNQLLGTDQACCDCEHGLCGCCEDACDD